MKNMFCLGNTFDTEFSVSSFAFGQRQSTGPNRIASENFNQIQRNATDEQASESGVTHEKALDTFLRVHERNALRMAQLGTRQREDAMDLVQDAMLGFVKSYALNAAKAAPRGDWAKLFFTILDSRLMDWHRRQSVRNRFRVFFGVRKDGEDADDDVTNYVADTTTAEPDRVAMSAQSAPAINAALLQLPERQRQAFLLRMWQGFDVAQTAEVMRCSEGSVKTHLSRAMERLRALLESLK